jgi:hypothetical protein
VPNFVLMPTDPYSSLIVPALGWGAMNLTSYYGNISEDEDFNKEIIKLVRLSRLTYDSPLTCNRQLS